MQQSNDRALMLCHIPMQLFVLFSCSLHDTKLTKIKMCNYSILYLLQIYWNMRSGIQRGYTYTYKLVKNTFFKSEIIYFNRLELWDHARKIEHTQNQHRNINNKFFRHI